METVTLSPDLQDFARQAVASGRYRDIDEVVGKAVSLLRRMETERAVFIGTLEAAQAEGERIGFSSIEDVASELDAIIDAAQRSSD
jgi:antitoxin ParD1/3/4